MSIHIGKLIRERAKQKRLSQETIGSLINTTKQNVGNIYKRKSIDTDLLLKICEALEHNFFEYYYSEEPLKSMRTEQMKKYHEENARLNRDLHEKTESMRVLRDLVETQKENMQFKEKEIKYLTGKAGSPPKPNRKRK
jgi:transcriptional regulator with XRE-family HTH domain